MVQSLDVTHPRLMDKGGSSLDQSHQTTDPCSKTKRHQHYLTTCKPVFKKCFAPEPAIESPNKLKMWSKLTYKTPVVLERGTSSVPDEWSSFYNPPPAWPGAPAEWRRFRCLRRKPRRSLPWCLPRRNLRRSPSRHPAVFPCTLFDNFTKPRQ